MWPTARWRLQSRLCLLNSLEIPDEVSIAKDDRAGCLTSLTQHSLLTSALLVQVALEELLDSFPQVQLSRRVGLWLATKQNGAPHCGVKARRAVRHVRDLQKVSRLGISHHLKGLFFAMVCQRCSGVLRKQSTVPVLVILGDREQEVAACTFNWDQGRWVLLQGRAC